MKTFQDLNLPEALQEALLRMQYSQPTEIQAKAIPIAMQGHDILGSAQTGTGKTAAFGIPLVNKLIEDETASALILAPTRELAEQVIDVLHQLLNKRRDIKTALLIGGMPIQKQFLRLKERPRVIVGTPGRINDHLDRRSLNLNNTKILVLDEADRMLDMGFGIQLEAIAKHLPPVRQTFMFSATLPNRILALSQKFLTNPQRIKVGATHSPLAKIKQDVVRTSEDGKFATLLKELSTRTGSVIIFAKTKRRVDQLAIRLRETENAGAMHGDLRQHQRARILKEFRDQKYRVLVATDVAARGLDIPHIEHVINYDLPQAPEDYIHRIGRTARGLAEGSAVCFISREEEKYWRAIERLLGGDESAPAYQRGGGRSSDRGQSRGGFGGRDSGSRPYSRDGGRFSDQRGSRDESRPRRAADGRPPFERSGGSSYGQSKPYGDRNQSPARRDDARPSFRGAPAGGQSRDRGHFGGSDQPRERSRFGGGSEQPRGRFAGGSSDQPRERSRFGGGSEQPRGRFAGGSDQPRERSRFGGGSEQPRGRFAGGSDQPRERSRFGGGSEQPRGRFAGGSDQPRERSRFGGGSEQPRGRFAGGSDQPRERSRFGGGSEQPRERSHFAGASEQPRERGRFTGNSEARPRSRFPEAPVGRGKFSAPAANRETARPAMDGARKPRAAVPIKGKSFGPQNRPRKPLEKELESL